MGAEAVELVTHLSREHAEVTGVDADRAQFRAGHLHRVGHARGDVVGVDKQRRSDAERVDLCPESRLLVGPSSVVCSSVNACALVPSAGTP